MTISRLLVVAVVVAAAYSASHNYSFPYRPSALAEQPIRVVTREGQVLRNGSALNRNQKDTLFVVRTGGPFNIDESFVPHVILYSNTTMTFVPTLLTTEEPRTYGLDFSQVQLSSGPVLLYVCTFENMKKESHVYSAPGSPWEIIWENSEGALSSMRPPCGLQHSGSGNWVREASASTRYGWSWEPTGCHFRRFRVPMLPQLQSPLWILVVGTSTTRGLFFEAVDMILSAQLPTNASHISHVNWWKCWGVLDFEIGNFRITYRDSREPWGAERLPHDYLVILSEWIEDNICPNEQHEWTALPPSRDGRTSPDIIIAENPSVFARAHDQCVSTFEEEGGALIGVSLKGRGAFTTVTQPKILSELEEFSRQNRSYIDIFPMSQAMYSHRRADPVHFIQQCDEGDKHVCSEVMEMELLMLLHTVSLLRPLTFDEDAKYLLEYRLCMECPLSFGHAERKGVHCVNNAIPEACLGENQHTNVLSKNACITP